MVVESARTNLVGKLKSDVPNTMLDAMIVRVGRAGPVLAEAAEQENAELIVLGGKHHSAIGRWVAGSTAHYLVRTHDRPLLLIGPKYDEPFRRILVPVDLSAASTMLVGRAERFAALVPGKVALLHVVEPIPIPPSLDLGLEMDTTVFAGAPPGEPAWPWLGDAERIVKRGPAAEIIAEVATEWKADLVVVGSHGYSWIDRVLIGSVTEQLLGRLPASLLVVPVPKPGKESRGPRRAKRVTQARSRRRAK
jgi:nucleotide-binding universal stress UspA family protein